MSDQQGDPQHPDQTYQGGQDGGSQEGNQELTPHHLGVGESGASINATSAVHKRKRDPLDHDGFGTRGGPGDNTRRSSFKRVSASNTTSLSTNNSGMINDPSGGSYLTANNSSGTGEDDMHNTSAGSIDFNALTQHQSSEPSGHQGSLNGGPDHSHATSTAAAALAGIFPTMTVPQPTDLSFASGTSGGEGDRNLDPSFGMGEHDGSQSQQLEHFGVDVGAPTGRAGSSREGSSTQKPAVGSDEWHRVRRDNHKEVERRRRETINEGINELSKIVPGCEKNKGSILQRAVSFITQLKENEAQNIEKWTLEKLLTEQAISELSASVDKLKNECERAWREAETWKKTCQSAGLTPRRSEEANTGNGTSRGES
ncbi:MAG: basic helix-loop-helix protein [Trichoglossum hirsutum]|nr:MAG: basic helix-loop-helix protein [Trichoglossum hirsutum]